MKRNPIVVAALAGVFLAGGSQGREPQAVLEVGTLSLQGARAVLDAALAEARRRNTTGAFAVVDAGGSLIAAERLDGTFPAASNVAIGKARTAAAFRKPTRFFEDVIRNGRTPMVALDDFTPLQGGVPVMVNGEVVGAIGVSGAASAQEDEDLAAIGAAGAGGSGSAAPEVTHMPASDVRAAFEAGMPLVENASFKVHASRRDRPGQAEVHAGETDVIYVLEGEATLVTGGRVVNGATTAPGELRGSSIEGGTGRALGAGDFVIVPAGVPHWFSKVNGPFLYYVVKVHP